LETFTAESVKVTVFWIMTPYSLGRIPTLPRSILPPSSVFKYVVSGKSVMEFKERYPFGVCRKTGRGC
jgi:hypothetical protein